MVSVNHSPAWINLNLTQQYYLSIKYSLLVTDNNLLVQMHNNTPDIVILYLFLILVEYCQAHPYVMKEFGERVIPL